MSSLEIHFSLWFAISDGFDNPQVKYFFCVNEGWDILPTVLAMSSCSFCNNFYFKRQNKRTLVSSLHRWVAGSFCSLWSVLIFPFSLFFFLCVFVFSWLLPSSLPPSNHSLPHFLPPLFLFFFWFGILYSELRVSHMQSKSSILNFSIILTCMFW